VALEFFQVLDELLPSIRSVGEYFHAALCQLAARRAVVKEVRGVGLMLGMELAVPGKQAVLDAMADGLLINCTHDTVLRFLPAYILTEKQASQAVRILARVLSKIKP
jgi:acetylornithine/succinyldiaminopimelate/putrescine aminotransferase